MDEMEDNTTVLSTLRSFNKFLSQPFEGTPPSANTSNTSGASLQMQFQQRFLLEDQAAQIRSKSQFIQVEREKIQMELSHKRARIELEKEASTNAMNYEREADRNQDLLTRIKALEEKEMEFQSKLQEQTEMYKSSKKTIELQSKKLIEKENKLAEANEAISVLKGKVSELQLKVMNQEMQIKTQETEKQELNEQLEILRKKMQDSTHTTQALQELQVLTTDYELKIKTLEQKLSSQEQDAAIVKNMKSDLEKLPKIERELQQLREENSYHREMRENNALLKEEVESLRRAAERYDRMKEELVALELDKEKILKKLKSWENMEQTTGLSIKTPDDISRQILAIQQREIKLKEENLSITNSARMFESARKKLQEEQLKTQGNYLEEKKKREQHEALVRRLQKRVLLLSKERDGMRAILDSYDSELTPSEHNPQLSRRLREAEENLQKVHAHNAEMEVQLSQALEETGLQKQRAELLTAELSLLKSQMSTTDQSASITSEAVNSLRLKIEELEAERGRLEEENRNLEMRLERLSLQGCYDPSKVKVIHFSMNPASKAKQQRKDEVQNLQEECNKLRELVRILEGGAAVTDKLEVAGSIQTPIQEVTELKKQVESAELKNQRLREVFQTKIHEFRTVCYMLTGYRIDITTENQYRLTSMYAEHKDDNLLFKEFGQKIKKMKQQRIHHQTIHRRRFGSPPLNNNQTIPVSSQPTRCRVRRARIIFFFCLVC
ncbi:mitotic spindle assembly checkpoint protein MAD1 isoform X1 [Hyla sarda]|uniref:mitotic spindle assembly checkpoint protein MAD1 isoform X1 n=2 Tax=Hyla sarda TaxID=327740 RepID=UPI0024C423FB|nr:mitotic spindle assembly checkpoint protein MAD1 isoform X1 [Hyla sarda]